MPWLEKTMYKFEILPYMQNSAFSAEIARKVKYISKYKITPLYNTVQCKMF